MATKQAAKTKSKKMYVEEKKLGETEIDGAAKILLDAADYTERHGWCQNVYTNGLGDVCIMGTLLQACSGRTTSRDVLRKFFRG